jgi:hypothetical protein
MNLEKLLKETDALTYVNALKVTQTEIKDSISTIEELQGYVTQECEKLRKLVRKADNQYRMVAKLVQNGEVPFATNVEVEANLADYEEVMKNER